MEKQNKEQTTQSEDSKHVFPVNRVLSLMNRGITGSHSQLKTEVEMLLPHVKRDNKFDCDLPPKEIAGIARQRNCNFIMYWETRHHRDLTLWLSNYPNGPTIMFHISNIKTAENLQFIGNFKRYTRPIVSFDSSFDENELALDVRITKEMLKKTFSTPYQYPKSAPFVDHIIQFTRINAHASKESKNYILSLEKNPYDQYRSSAAKEDPITLNPLEIEFRCYEISYDPHRKVSENICLTEAGPRFTLTPIKILDACMFGTTIWRNPSFISMAERIRIQKQEEKKLQEHNVAQRIISKRTDRKSMIDPINSLFEGKSYLDETGLNIIGTAANKNKTDKSIKNKNENENENELDAFDEEELEELEEGEEFDYEDEEVDDEEENEN